MQLIVNQVLKVLLAQMLEILDNLRVGKEQEAVARILISLTVLLHANCVLRRLNFLLVVLLLILLHAAAPAANA